MQDIKRNKTTGFILLIFSSIFLFLLDLFTGSINIPFSEICSILFTGESIKETWKVIVLESRLPQTLAAILAGASLAVSGLQMQTLFKNPLAGPYILGISSGAGLGVAIFIMGLGFLGISAAEIELTAGLGTIVAAILGSTLVLFILLAVINRLKDIMTVLILGIMIGSIITAIIGIIQYFSYDAQLKSFVMWTMGDLSSVTNQQVMILLPIVLLGTFLSFAMSKALNSYLLGESNARSLGINIKKSRFYIIAITSLLTGSITAFCGPIGFVGIIVPHFARMLSNTYDHKTLIPLSILIGVNILLLADIISQLPTMSHSLPINSITSLIGIPFIIWVIFKNKRISNLN